ncbi:MAG: HNH endonuclease [Acidobacteriota bacterium]
MPRSPCAEWRRAPCQGPFPLLRPQRAELTSQPGVRQRLHQQGFRQRVLQAYREHCALCYLRHVNLIDAAHIIPDGEGGEPTVANGLALCKLHHAAYDGDFLAVRPDYVIEVHPDVLREKDGPMLLHGLQQMHHRSLFLPRSRADQPSPVFLQERYTRFLGQENIHGRVTAVRRDPFNIKETR